MRKTVLIILVLTICVGVSLAGSTELAEPTPPPQPTPTAPTPGSTATATTIGSITSLAGSTVLSISLAGSDPDPAIAGDVVEVRIAVENMGGTTAKNLMMEILPEYPFTLVPGENAVKNIGIVEGYEVDSTANIKVIKYKLKIDKDTSAGSYELKVKYYEPGSGSVIKSIYIDVKNRANVEVIHVDKTALVPGKQSGLKFTINNVGNAPLRDITFNWENKDNKILPVGSDNTRHIKYIDINEGFDLEYQVIADTNANPGLYKLDIYMIYTDSINGTKNQLSTIAGVYVGGETDFDIAFSESTNSETSFNVANIRSNPAYAVLVIIPEQENWKVSGSNSVMIGNLNSGDYTVASFKLRSSTNIMTSSASKTASVHNSPSEIIIQVAYTDTMGERRLIDKEVKLEPQNIATTDDEISKKGQQSPNFIVYIIGIVAFLFLISAYQKYRRQKLFDPDLKITDLFRGKKK